MRAYAVTLATLFTTLSLAGCGGGGHAGSPSSAFVPPTSGQAPSHGTNAPGSATLKITIPAKGTASAKRRAQYVSASTTQLKIDVEQAGTSVTGYPETVGLTPTSAGCTATSGSTVCTIDLSLAVGSYTANLTAEDTGGNALSVATNVALTVVSGTNSPVDVALSGIVNAITLTSTSPLVTGTQAGGFTLVGPGAEPFVVNALDADGNVIVGAGAPTLTVTQSGAPAFTITQPTAAAPNTLSLAAPATFASGNAQVTVTASYPGATNACTQASAVCSASVSMNMQELVAIMYENPAEIDFFADGSTTKLASITAAEQPTGLDSPSGFVFDSSGNMYVANDALFGPVYNIAVYAPPYSGTPTLITSGINAPGSIAMDSSNNLFVGNLAGGTGDDVTEYPPGTTSPSRTFASDIQSDSICADPSGDVYVSQSSGSGIDALQEYPPGATTASATLSGYLFSKKIVCDGLGNVFQAQYGYDDLTAEYIISVNKFSPGLALVGGLGGVVGPNGLTVDSANNVYVGNSGGASTNIVKIPPGSLNPSLTITANTSVPDAIDADASGNIFYSNYSGNGMYEFLSGLTTLNATYPGENSFVTGLTIVP